ncbi:MAG: type II secretion system F family protein [Bryobacteraceae bacterium]|nr:type II secretion system F family protein [Bryobacteraceae bacterium]
MELWISLGLFLFLAAVITLYGYHHFARPGRIYAQLGGASAPAVVGEGDKPPFYGVVAALAWAGEKVPVSAEEASAVRRELMMAGFRQDHAVAVFLGAKLVSAALLLALALALRPVISPPGILNVVIPGVAAVLGYFLPSLVLDFLIGRRQETLRLSLPDALDLLVVCVEAGLGLDQALRTVSSELKITHPELCDELSLVSLEMRAGVSRATALNNLAERTGEDEVRKLVAVLVQTDRFGTSMADALRTHSEFMRVRRRQEAEERANKVGVKLILPIFFLMLPSILIVAAGPGLLMIFKNLFPLIRDAQF